MKDSKNQSVASQSASRWLASLAMMASTALASPAIACPPDESEGENGLHLRPDVEIRHGLPILSDLPMVGPRFRVIQTERLVGGGALRATAMHGEPSSKVVMVYKVDGHTYEVHIEDGKTTAKADGQEIPSSRVRSIKGQISLLDEDGKVLVEFPQAEEVDGPLTMVERGPHDGAVAMSFSRSGEPSRLRLVEPGESNPIAIASTPPSVMMGITMSEPADDSDGGILVDKVMEGLPAQKAGLKSGDKLVQLDGEDIEGVMEFRESLAEHKAGDEISLKVLRDGKELDVKVKLEAYDATTLEPFVAEIRRSNGERAAMSPAERGGYEAAKRSIEEAMKALGDAKVSDEVRASAVGTLAKALKSLEEGRANQRSQWLGQNDRFVTPGQPGELFITPTPRTPQAWGGARSVDLEQKIDLLGKRLDEALARIEARGGETRTPTDSLNKAREQLEMAQRENAELKKKIQELQAKLGGN